MSLHSENELICAPVTCVCDCVSEHCRMCPEVEHLSIGRNLIMFCDFVKNINYDHGVMECSIAFRKHAVIEC